MERSVCGGAGVAQLQPLPGVKDGAVVIVRGLLRAHADANASFQGWSPLLRALTHRHEETVEALLQAGADTTFATEDGRTPLIMLVMPVPGEPTDASGARLVARLLGAGVATTVERRDCNGCTALGATCLRGNVLVAESLLAGRADVIACTDGVTPLTLALAGDATGAAQARLVRMLGAAARADAADHKRPDGVRLDSTGRSS